MSGYTQPRSAIVRILSELDLKADFFKEIICNRHHGNFVNQIIFSGKMTAQKYYNIIASCIL